MAIGIAEQIIKKDLSANQEHENLVTKLVDEIKLN